MTKNNLPQKDEKKREKDSASVQAVSQTDSSFYPKKDNLVEREGEWIQRR